METKDEIIQTIASKQQNVVRTKIFGKKIGNPTVPNSVIFPQSLSLRENVSTIETAKIAESGSSRNLGMRSTLLELINAGAPNEICQS